MNCRDLLSFGIQLKSPDTQLGELTKSTIIMLLMSTWNKHWNSLSLSLSLYIYIYVYIYIYIYIYIYKYEVHTIGFQTFFVWALLLIVHENLVPFEIISSGCNALVPFQQLLEGPMEVLLCERVNDLRHSLFHLLNCLITTVCELRE